jgi:replicative DNA helicase
MGKSAFALSMALNLATRSCKPDGSKARSALFTLEMCQQEIYERILSSQAQVDLDVIVRRKPNPDERVKLDQACADLQDAPLNVIDNSMATVASIRAYIRKSIMDGNRLDVVFVDYLQLLSSIGRSESRNLEVAAFSRELKAIALEYDITVVALAQLSRSVESRTIGDRPCLPKLSDLRDSGSIEQDADIVMFLYRQSYYDPEINPVDKNRCSIIVAKNRSGETGEMALLFRGEQVRFDNACLDPVSVETIRL